MFIGRKEELEALHEEFSSQRKSAVLVYGKRRVGKSSLIREASKGFDGTVVYHLCVRTTFEGNLELLSRSITMALGLPQMKFSTIFDLFDFVKIQTGNGMRNGKILIILDEYQYFKESMKELELDSCMQAVIDGLVPEIKMVLCGSYISVMRELLLESNPLFGRFSRIIRLEEFDYYESSLFYPELSVREKIRFYSVFGGSPYVLTNLDTKKSLEENVMNLLIKQSSLFRTYIENVMLREIQKSYDTRILEVIGNGKKRYNEISSALAMNDTGLLDKQLKNLLGMETLVKVFPINKAGDRKKQFYEIKDNLMRMYFTYVFANETLIAKLGERSFFESAIKSSLNTFISLRFEDMVIQYFMRRSRNGTLGEIKDFGSYWYDDRKTGTNGQFDCVLKTNEGYDFYEVKFYEKPMTQKECMKEEMQIRSLTQMNCTGIGFVCSAGFDFESDKYTLLSAEDLYDL